MGILTTVAGWVIPSWVGPVLVAGGIAAASVAVHWYGESHYERGAKDGRAEVQKTFDAYKVAQERAYTSALAKTRDIENALNEINKEASRAREAERNRTAAVADVQRADDQRLRDDVRTYARGLTLAQDSLAAARERAETLGELLDSALSAHLVCSREAEDLASDVRSLRNSWPRLEGS